MPAMPLWPWWLGALGFTTVAILHLVVLRRPLGVSGLLRTALSGEKRREERDLKDVDDDDLQRALEEATRRAFGGALPIVDDATPAAPTTSSTAPPPALPWSRSVLFLVGLVGGGLLSALLQGPVVEVMPEPAGPLRPRSPDAPRLHARPAARHPLRRLQHRRHGRRRPDDEDDDDDDEHDDGARRRARRGHAAGAADGGGHPDVHRLKPAAAEIVRTSTVGDVVTAETLIGGCGELKRYTVRCTVGADCDVGAAADPFAAVGAAAVDAARKATGCAEVEAGRLKDSAERTVDGVAVRSAVVKVRGCGSIWNYETTCTGDTCVSRDVDAPAATPGADPDLDVGAIPDLGDINLSDVDAAGPVE